MCCKHWILKTCTFKECVNAKPGLVQVKHSTYPLSLLKQNRKHPQLALSFLYLHLFWFACVCVCVSFHRPMNNVWGHGTWGMEIAQWRADLVTERLWSEYHQEQGDKFLLQGQLAVLTLIQICSFHPYVATVACEKSWSFFQRCRWQVTAKHTCTLHMWLCIKWHCKLVYGFVVYAECVLMWQSFYIMAPAIDGYSKVQYKRLDSFIQNHVTRAQGVLESREQH